METVILRTPRLELSTPGEIDIDVVYLACQDHDIQRYTTIPSPYLREHAETFVGRVADHWERGIEATWAIRHDDELIGMIGLYRLGSGSAEIGYWMTRAHRGHGYLTEAARAVVDWAFAADGLAAARVEWRAVVGNIASARAARTLGFRYEGMLRQALSNSFGRDDSWVAGLLPSDDRSPQQWPVLAD